MVKNLSVVTEPKIVTTLSRAFTVWFTSSQLFPLRFLYYAIDV
jgi:hypothetical protein